MSSGSPPTTLPDVVTLGDWLALVDVSRVQCTIKIPYSQIDIIQYNYTAYYYFKLYDKIYIIYENIIHRLSMMHIVPYVFIQEWLCTHGSWVLVF